MENKKRAVFLDLASLGPGIDLSPLADHVELISYPATGPTEVEERIRGAHVVVSNKVQLDALTIAAASELELVVVAATGTDNVDLEAAADRGVAVYNIRDYCTDAVSQHVWALILALTQGIERYRRVLATGGWQAAESFCLFDHPIRSLQGCVLGLVGYGALAGGVERIGKAFGMEVLLAALPGRSYGVDPRRVPWDDFLPRVDILSLHCPLTADTESLIGAQEFVRMKPDSLLINTARGGLVDGAALVRALQRGEIAGAGIDVLPEEPPRSGHPLLEFDSPNLLVTPHVAWAAREARQRAVAQVAENVADFYAGREGRRQA